MLMASFALVLYLPACQNVAQPYAHVASAELQIQTRINSETLVAKIQPNAPGVATEGNVQIGPAFKLAKQLVEKFTHTDLYNVKLNLTEDDVITREVSLETERLVNSQFSNAVFADRFLNSVMQGQAGTYAALYATRRSEVMISMPLLHGYLDDIPNIQQRELALLALLIHELVHAADDRRYQIHDNRKLNFRASFAQSAVFEGHAQWITRQICEQYGCTSGLVALDEFMFTQNNPPNQLTQSVQAVSRNILEYSYIEGERFMSELASRENGEHLITQLLKEAPADPVQILEPSSYPDIKREQRNQRLITASAAIDHIWNRQPWVQVETSPLKGVNLRADPSKRQAAVDGFTRLITAMVSIQIYNQTKPDLSPIEVTLITAESNDTARLFTETLHQNTRVVGAQLTQQTVHLGGRSDRPLTLFQTREAGNSAAFYFTVIAQHQNYVVQVTGHDHDNQLLIDYAQQLLLGLQIESMTNRSGSPKTTG